MKLKEINFTQKKAKDFNILIRLYQFYTMYVIFLPIFGGLFYKFKVKRNKNIDKKKLYIVAPNHVSYLDVFAINWVMGMPLAYIAKQELFRIETSIQRYVAKNIWRLGAFAVNREKPSISTIKSVKEVFKANYSLCIFPEGGIRKNKTIENINGGFIYFAKANKVDIIPVSINGLEKYNWNPFKKQEVTFNIGEPISYELAENEILKQWCEQICKLNGYQNLQKF